MSKLDKLKMEQLVYMDAGDNNMTKMEGLGIRIMLLISCYFSSLEIFSPT